MAPKTVPILITGKAPHSRDGQPVSVIAALARSLHAVASGTDCGGNRVRTVLVRHTKHAKIVFLQPLPAELDIERKLDGYGLSGREKEVAVWASRGLSNKEIADRLFLCEQTVKDHLHAVFQHMQLHRRSELAAMLLGLRSP
jgi:DNA-binding NarL/FixJ family response regulator